MALDHARGSRRLAADDALADGDHLMPSGDRTEPGPSLYPECYRPGTSGARRHWLEGTVTCERCRREQRHKCTKYRMKAEAQGPRTISAIGTQRRINALARIGYNREYIGAALRIHPAGLTRIMRQDVVWVGTAEMIQKVYERLVSSGVIGPSAYSRSRSIRLGLPGPMDWDEDTIDNPDAVPACVVERDHAEALVLLRAEMKRRANKARAAANRARARAMSATVMVEMVQPDVGDLELVA